MPKTSYKISKTALDLIGGLLGSFLFILSYPIIGLAIKINTRGPILVKLDRVSNGRTVKIYKFRSMVKNAHELKAGLIHLNERRDGPFFKIKNDPRVTKTGRFIRRFRLDELPQFINVLKGELSLVGPRPHEPEEVAKYPLNYQFLAKAKAGITGASQVNGASSLSFLSELQIDSDYLKKQSLGHDLKIIGKTVAIMFFDYTAV